MIETFLVNTCLAQFHWQKHCHTSYDTNVSKIVGDSGELDQTVQHTEKCLFFRPKILVCHSKPLAHKTKSSTWPMAVIQEGLEFAFILLMIT